MTYEVISEKQDAFVRIAASNDHEDNDANYWRDTQKDQDRALFLEPCC